MRRYIDADKLINELEPVVKSAAFKNRNIRSNVNKCWEIVNNQPTADVRENVRGEWRTTYLDHVAMGERPKILYCSVCNQCIAYPTNFCPNCGASMRGDNDV